MRPPLLCAYLIALVAVIGWAGTANAQATDGQIVRVSKFYPAPGREGELQARFLRVVEYVRKVEPKTVYRLHRSIEGPVVFLWYEVYESKEAWEHHRNVVLPAFQKEYGPAPDGIFARPPERESYQDISK